MTLPTPVYDRDGITLYHGDCRDILPALALAQKQTIVLTDPPYNVGLDYGQHTDDARLDYDDWCRQWFDACHRIAHLIAFTPGVQNVARWCRLVEPDWMVAWHKPFAHGRSPVGFANWEPVLIFGESLAPPGDDVITASIQWDPDLEGHPCPKPLRWATKLLTLLSLPHEMVIDPFAGSGTTLVAARQLGRRAIGIEIDRDYCDFVIYRLRQGVLPLEPTTAPDPVQTEMF